MDKRQKLAKTLANMSVVTPLYGIIHAIIHGVMFFGLAIAVFVLSQRDFRLALLAALALAIVYTAILVTAHDCIHHTYTGLKWFDDYWPVYWTALMSWPHHTYTEIHKIHHAYLGKDFEDPERPTFLRSEYERASWWRRWYIRHQWLINIFIFGGIGFTVKHWLKGYSLRKKFPQISAAMRKDIITVGVISLLHLWLVISYFSFFDFLIIFYVVERVGGALMQLRALAEHYGLWASHKTDTTKRQALSSRNIKSGWFFRWLFNDLCFHSIHHVYPSIPWYKLGEAHLILPSLWDDFNPKIIEPRDGYGKVFADGVRSWRLIDDRTH